MFSSHNDADFVQNSISMGADAILFKPLRMSDVKSMWQFVLRKRRETARQQRLEVENARLEVSRQKDLEAMDFLSHQLKTRFTTCLVLVDGLRQTLAEVAPLALRMADNATDCLDDLTGQLQRGERICMDAAISKQLMHDTYTLRSRSVDLRDELHNFCGRRITLHVVDSIPALLELDINLILHVLENFASNAGKYGGGAVHLRVYRTIANSVGGPRLAFAVTNPPGKNHATLVRQFGEDASSLFGLGVQGAQAAAMSNGNGLYLVGKCAVALGGVATLRFLADEVCAELTLPLDEADVGTLPAATRIASLDDSDLTRMMDAAAFAELGVEAFVRGETLDEIKRFPEFVASLEPPPSLVMVDYRLDHPMHGTPYLLGTELLPRLRALGFAGKLVIKSANDTAADIARFKADGADDAISKGLSVSSLGRELARVLGKVSTVIDSFTLASYSAPMRRIAVRGFREAALAAVDAAVDAAVIVAVDHAAVDAAVDGAVAAANAAWGHIHRLKGMAAYVGATELMRVCESMRRTSPEQYGDALTRVRRSVEAALAALAEEDGDDGHGEKGGGGGGDNPSGDDGPTPAPPPSAALEQEAEPHRVMDLQAALAAAGNSSAILLPVVRAVRRLDIGPLVTAAEAGNLSRVRSLAHRMGGDASYVHAEAFCAACRRLSSFQGDAEAMQPLVQAMATQYQLLAQELERVEGTLG